MNRDVHRRTSEAPPQPYDVTDDEDGWRAEASASDGVGKLAQRGLDHALLRPGAPLYGGARRLRIEPGRHELIAYDRGVGYAHQDDDRVGDWNCGGLARDRMTGDDRQGGRLSS